MATTSTPSRCSPAACDFLSPDQAEGTNVDSDEFVPVVREKVPDVSAGRTDAEITTVAELACRALAAGRTADQLVTLVRTLGTLDAAATYEATARELVKLAIETTCQVQAARVDEF